MVAAPPEKPKAPPVPPEGHDALCPCPVCLDLKVSRNLELRLYLLAIRKIADARHATLLKAGHDDPDNHYVRIGKLAALALGRPFPAPKAFKVWEQGK